ncbi:MAG: TIGR01777 family oxidoreductase [Opitutales bacterium]|nr:TIGR01777 family oxidoreductase [Opitutales bacterium]
MIRQRRLLVTGGTGLIGKSFILTMEAAGWRVRNLTRAPHHARDIAWNPSQGVLPTEALDGVDVVVHLAGENLAEGRWTEARRRLIRESRVLGTELLAKTMAQKKGNPSVFISASGASCYLDDGFIHDEHSPLGRSFLAQLVREWEAACHPAREAGIRTVHMRMGMVLDPHGGALSKMLPFYRKGLGGIIGSGRQHLNWITVRDLIRIIQFCIDYEFIQGPLNAVSPKPVRQAEFASVLASYVGKPALVPLPRYVVKLLYGQMGEELLLGDMNVIPAYLRDSGFEWLDSSLDLALKNIL